MTDRQKQWDKKDSWRRFGKGFSVEIVHTVRPFTDRDGEAIHLWGLYANIASKHPIYERIRSGGNRLSNDEANKLPLYGSCSWLRWYTYGDALYDGEYVTVGCDFDHDMDDYFRQAATLEQAYSVTHYADKLFNYLESVAQQLVADAETQEKEDA